MQNVPVCFTSQLWIIRHGAEGEKCRDTLAKKYRMARLYTFSEIKKNGTVNDTAISKRLNCRNVLTVQTVTDNFTGTAATYTLLRGRVNDDSEPDMYYSTSPASAVAASINTANTTNNIFSIPLTVSVDDAVTSFSKYFDPMYIYEVLPHPTVSADSIMIYEEPQAPEGFHRVYQVIGLTPTQVAALANA